MKKHILGIICIVVFVAVFTSVYLFSGKGNTTTQLANPQGSSISSISQNTPASNNTSCIISISGNRYDVTVFRNMHSGGNIFQCGTDMTNIFYSQHGSRYLALMAAYRII